LIFFDEKPESDGCREAKKEEIVSAKGQTLLRIDLDSRFPVCKHPQKSVDCQMEQNIGNQCKDIREAKLKSPC